MQAAYFLGLIGILLRLDGIRKCKPNTSRLSNRRRSARYRRGGGGAGAGFGGGAVGVEGKQAGEHFVADFVGPAPAVGFLLAAPGGFVDRVVEEEVAGGGTSLQP